MLGAPFRGALFILLLLISCTVINNNNIKTYNKGIQSKPGHSNKLVTNKKDT